jgi:hypothetical protein
VYRRLDAALRQARKDEQDLELRALIDEEYTCFCVVAAGALIASVCSG